MLPESGMDGGKSCVANNRRRAQKSVILLSYMANAWSYRLPSSLANQVLQDPNLGESCA